MKKIYIILICALLAATPALAASVVGSRHDMVASDFATGFGGSTEVCIFCHTPHGAQTAFTQVPLWNNTPSASLDFADIYSSSTVINGISTQNFAVSEEQINATDARLCLACHDGGVGEPINQPNSGDMDISTTKFMDANTLLGTNLSNDHPIGMDLTDNPQLIDPYIRTFDQIKTGFGEKNPFFGANNTMWCSSCHDVHDNLNIPFLRLDNAGSALCKACHIK